jgi:pyrimidine-nucleoside phosphorylase
MAGRFLGGDTSRFPLNLLKGKPASGYLSQIRATVGGGCCAGAGRARVDQRSCRFVIHRKVGDQVEKGDPLFTIHANDRGKLKEARQAALSAHVFSEESVGRLPLFYE